MVCICYQLANKTRNLLFDRTIIIGFVRFVANLLNRPKRPKKCVRKRVTFRPLVSTKNYPEGVADQFDWENEGNFALYGLH
jgi:hypothetical protein